jgi:dehydrogenase/reductase SDR family protein 7B
MIMEKNKLNCSMIWKEKKVWIIGASSGIGQGLSIELNKAGAYVVLSARSSDKLQNTQKLLTYPNQSDIIELDLSNTPSIQAGIQTYQNRHQKLDILIHSGGISQRAKATETSIETTRQIFESNFFGQIPISLAAVDMMKNQGNGKIVVITSFTGKWGFFLRSSYAASKHALHGFYESLRMEVEEYGIEVQLVTPGFIATDISKNAVDGDGKATGEMDENQANGISTQACARQIMHGIEKNKWEFGVGGKEKLGLWIHRHFPNYFQKLLRKQSAR